MDSTYYVRLKGKVLGPFSMEQLVQLKQQGRLSPFHEVSDDRKTWTVASSIAGLFPANTAAPVAPPVKAPVAAPASPRAPAPSQWHYRGDDGKQVGPISHDELHRLVQDGTIGEQTLVWHAGLSAWTPLGQVDWMAPSAASGNGPSQQQADPEAAYQSWEDRVGWRRVRFGLTLFIVAAFLLITNLVLGSFGGLVAGFGGSTPGMLFVLATCLAVGYLARLIETVGHGFYLGVPAASGARGYGIAALIFAIIDVLLFCFPVFILFLMASAVNEPLADRLRLEAGLGLLNLVVMTLTALCNFVRVILLHLYFRAVATHLRDPALAGMFKHLLVLYTSWVVFVVFTGVATLLFSVVTATDLLRDVRAVRDVLVLFIVLGVLGVLAALLWLVWFVFYLLLLFKTRGLVSKHAG